MSTSDGESEHSRKETMEARLHKSDMELENQNEEDSKPKSPKKKWTRYTPQERNNVSYYNLEKSKPTNGIKTLHFRA